ncbi:unnamed protein product [Didymodactylos carnosus]|uniref:Pentatricopeptide repeat-containing protein n=1 Tax=Didymodactylos carnosus TaxID=1234261 RepID=A0A8S2MTT2_9BILA|nr:unnamed protein product [Didymodactylos carnosus]CAF3972795.1 unnamed protein product [Didymodactylos carnosus]
MFNRQLLVTLSLLKTKSQFSFVTVIININNYHNLSLSSENKNIIEWSLSLKKHKINKQNEEALKLFHNGINKQKLIPNYIIYLLAIGICTDLENVKKGKEIHEMINNSEDNIKNNIKIQSALINMYMKCHDVMNAEIIFNNVKQCDIITVNSMMKGYNVNELPEKTIQKYEQMIKNQIQPNNVTYLLIFKACGECVRLGK